MRKYTLVAFRDDVTGEVGLGIAGLPRGGDTLADTSGELTAHDVLEHVNGPAAIGGIADELEALGAIWYGRGQCGLVTRRPTVRSPITHLAADLARMARDAALGADADLSVPRTRACECDADLEAAIMEARTMARDELQHDGEHDTRRLALYWRAALARMRIGYRKAARRYGAADKLTAIFWAVADAIAGAMRGADMYEGAEFTLRIDRATGRAYCDQSYGSEYA